MQEPPPVLPAFIKKVIIDVVLMMAKIRNQLCVIIIELARSMTLVVSANKRVESNKVQQLA